MCEQTEEPLAQFRRWLDEAIASGVDEPHAMVLATAAADGRPSARVLLLKDLVGRAFVFATNYESRKAEELSENPNAALVFHWHALHRQVRVEGRIERGSDHDSDAIHADRPRGSQLAAWCSPQSRPIDSRDELREPMRVAALRFPDRVPRPPHWGAYRLLAERIEFWEGGEDRLHDRRCHVRRSDGSWYVRQLAP